VETHVIGERTWNDYKKKGDSLKKGNFTEEEIKTLMKALCNYVKQKEVSSEDDALNTLTILCSRSKHELPQELKGAWPVIAESLQHRSVQSCHNLCRRKFNPSNYQGSWSKEEEEILQGLVGIHGKSWNIVSKKLVEMGGRERTAGNCKDKFKQMGEDNAVQRDLGPWTLSEGIKLF